MKRLTTRQRVERMVERRYPYADVQDRTRMVDLLLAEHRRLRAKVRDLRQCGFHAWSDNPDFIAGYEQACEDILKAMR